MGKADGTIGALTKLLGPGFPENHWNLLFIAEGYTASQAVKFENDAKAVAMHLLATAPFDDLSCGINVYALNVSSTDSGADDPTCADGLGANVFKATYFDAKFCDDTKIQRLLGVEESIVSDAIDSLHLTWHPHKVVVLVNSSIYGGSADFATLTVCSMSASAGDLVLHELGHALGLQDEYESYGGCPSTGSEPDHDTYPPGAAEPTYPNITIETDPLLLKWRDVIWPGIALPPVPADPPIPTLTNPVCSTCNPAANPVGDATVGLFAGAATFRCGVYRPQYRCKMFALDAPGFCGVCERQIRKSILAVIATIDVVTASIDFGEVPPGWGGAGVRVDQPITIEVHSCVPVTLKLTSVTPAPPFAPVSTSAVVIGPSIGAAPATGTLTVSYTSTADGDVAIGTATVECVETGAVWSVDLFAATVRKTMAVALVLDHSGSMSQDPGDGTTKTAKLKEAAATFVDLMQDDDALGIVRFDNTAQVSLPVATVGPSGAIAGARADSHVLIGGTALDPAGATSIGAGVQQAASALAVAQAAQPRDQTAMVVLTDGLQNTPPLLASVSGSITSRTYAIGLGQPGNLNVSALDDLTQNHGGYLVVTGAITATENARLTKYFLQILAGIENAEVILDPAGVLTGRSEHRIPFNVTEADYGLEVILLTRTPNAIALALETPGGERIDATRAGLHSPIQHRVGSGVRFFRLPLPASRHAASHAGTWSAHVSAPSARERKRPPLAYSLLVHCRSGLKLRAFLAQRTYIVGTPVVVAAVLTEYGLSPRGRVEAWADITRPDGSELRLALDREGGRFAAEFTASLSGIYRVRIRAAGMTAAGSRFHREQTLTAVVYQSSETQPAADPQPRKQ